MIPLELVPLKELFEEYAQTLPEDDDDETYADSRSVWKWESEAFLKWLEKKITHEAI